MRFIIVFLFSFISYTAYCQSINEYISKGDKAYDNGDYYSASKYYYQALIQDSTKIRLAYKYADACKMFNNYPVAEKWFSVVVENDEKKHYADALFWQAMMAKNLAKYEDASISFTRYVEENTDPKNLLIKRAKQEIESCKWAIVASADSIPVKTEHLGRIINTPYADFGAVQLKDSLLLFSSLRLDEKYENYESLEPGSYLAKIYESRITPAGFSPVNALSNRINEPGFHNSNICLSSDHRTAFFARCEDLPGPINRCALYMTRIRSGKWQKAVKLDERINVPGYTTTQASIAHAEKDDVLYFVSDRPGGQGGRDIWYAIVKRSRVLDPSNLGSPVNTPGDELTPFFDNKTSTLYFSSDWHKGFGGYDIFKTKGGYNQWGEPVNIGRPFNTSYNDLYFTVNQRDSSGFFTSNRPGSFFIKSSTCCNDIYSYKFEPKKTIVKQDIVNKDTISLISSIRQLLPLTLYFDNDQPDPSTTKLTTDKNYKTTAAEYYLLKQKYIQEYGKGLKGNDKKNAETEINEFFEAKVIDGLVKLEQFSGLLLQDLKAGSDIKITIKGYTSPLNTKEYNKNLAQRRIESLVNFFREYQDGIIATYLDKKDSINGRLILLEEPIGKEQANALVSDNPQDKRNSVYSRAAALERRIQVLYYESTENKSKIASIKSTPASTEQSKTTIKLNEEFFDFGTIRAGSRPSHDFTISNTGSAALRIFALETSCGCTIVDWPKEEIKPGGSAVITVYFDSNHKSGEQTENISIKANIPRGELPIFIRANVTR